MGQEGQSFCSDMDKILTAWLAYILTVTQVKECRHYESHLLNSYIKNEKKMVFKNNRNY